MKILSNKCTLKSNHVTGVQLSYFNSLYFLFLLCAFVKLKSFPDCAVVGSVIFKFEDIQKSEKKEKNERV